MGILRMPDSSRNSLKVRFLELFTGGVIELRTGGQPASADLPVSGTLLATLSLSGIVVDATEPGVLVITGIGEESAAPATGTASWARVKSSSGATVFDCDVGNAQSAAIIKLNSAAIVRNGNVRLASFRIAFPAE
jgi:hypothetical protein